MIGHANPAIGAAGSDVPASGTMFGAGTVPEIELAETMRPMIPCADLVRFANSGSEAIQGAVRAARGFTGRDKVLKFEGHHHGWADPLAVSNRPTAAEAGPYARPHAHPYSPGVPAPAWSPTWWSGCGTTPRRCAGSWTRIVANRPR
ncbi:aminotransferase class III-fold pyridoxal phosphate-dependent enzyme [Embleya sp. NPDC050493]|uniref:aminotransferase class III-fold pyridoxal phosphate-dependent enzyme n=1 Tax=Embleya sp. NPDC050493 TaxID=3363989 RepID=UPI0037A2365E